MKVEFTNGSIASSVVDSATRNLDYINYDVSKLCFILSQWEDEAAWIARAMDRHSQDPYLDDIIRFENAKITGRLPQLRYQFISNATLLAILEGVSIIRHGIRGAFKVVKSWGGGGIALA
jgi:hypothetical protein